MTGQDHGTEKRPLTWRAFPVTTDSRLPDVPFEQVRPSRKPLGIVPGRDELPSLIAEGRKDRPDGV